MSHGLNYTTLRFKLSELILLSAIIFYCQNVSRTDSCLPLLFIFNLFVNSVLSSDEFPELFNISQVSFSVRLGVQEVSRSLELLEFLVEAGFFLLEAVARDIVINVGEGSILGFLLDRIS